MQLITSEAKIKELLFQKTACDLATVFGYTQQSTCAELVEHFCGKKKKINFAQVNGYSVYNKTEEYEAEDLNMKGSKNEKI